MIKYKEFRPTQFDSKGAFIHDERKEWFVVPVYQNRDSDCLIRSNFDSAVEMLGGESENVEIHRFGHWGPGWFEIIIVKPDSIEYSTALWIEKRIEDYPVLDDDRYSIYLYKEMNETWDILSIKERIEVLNKKGISYLKARREYPPEELYPEDLGVY